MRRINFVRISVEGFGSFCNPTNFQLNRGSINMVKGKNGAGKTSLFSALAWCLYKVNLKGLNNGKVPTWERNRTEDFKGTRVIVEFSSPDEGFDYLVARHLDFKGTTKNIKGKDSLMIFKKRCDELTFEKENLVGDEQHKKDQQGFINRVIGLNDRSFLNSVLFGQKMKRLIEAPPDEKRKLFETLFEKEWIAQAKKNAEAKLAEENTKVEQLKNLIEKCDKSVELISSQLTTNKKVIEDFNTAVNQAIEDLIIERTAKELEFKELDVTILETSEKAHKYKEDALISVQADLAQVRAEIEENKAGFNAAMVEVRNKYDQDLSFDQDLIEAGKGLLEEQISEVNEKWHAKNVERTDAINKRSIMETELRTEMIKDLEQAEKNQMEAVSEIQKNSERLQKEVNAWGKSVSDYEASISVSQGKIEKWEKELAEVATVCPDCKQELKPEHIQPTKDSIANKITKEKEVLEVLTVKKPEIETNYENFKTEFLLCKENLAEAEAALADIRTNKTETIKTFDPLKIPKYAELAELSLKIAKEKTDLDIELVDLKKRLAEKTEELNAYRAARPEKLKQLVKDDKSLEAFNLKHEELWDKSEALNFKREEVEQEQVEYKKAAEELPVLHEKNAGVYREIESLRARILQKQEEKGPELPTTELEEQIAELQGQIDESNISKDRIQQRIEKLSWWVKTGFGSGGIKAFIFNSGLELLNQATEKYASRLGVKLKFSVDLSVASKPFITECFNNGVLIDYEELSGGQQARLNVATAFAMHDLISSTANINILILDEIFEALDPEGIETIFDLIRTKAGDNRTVYVVTHTPSIDALNTKTLEIELDQNGNSFIN